MAGTRRATTVGFLCLLLASGSGAGAGDRGLYFGLAFGASDQTNDFGGINTAGPHSNEDSQGSRGSIFDLTLGYTDLLSLGSVPITTEIEAQGGNAHHTVSASFPGLPNPEYFYHSTIRIQRGGVNLWAPLISDGAWTIAGGLGIGAQRTKLESVDYLFDGTDPVVETRTSDTTGYGMIGLRVLHALGANGRLAMDLRYYKAGETGHRLKLIENGLDAGELTHSASGVQVLIGYQFDI